MLLTYTRSNTFAALKTLSALALLISFSTAFGQAATSDYAAASAGSTTVATPAEKPHVIKHESELGTVIVSGNSKSQSINAKQTTSYEWGKNLVKAFASYTESEQASVVSARAWDAGLRYDRALTDTWSGFVARSAESNKFAGFTQRDNTDLGLAHKLLNNDKTTISAEAGYRLQEVNYVGVNAEGEGDETLQSARIYSEGNHKFNEAASAKLWVEYIPNFDDSDLYLLNAEPSLSVILSKYLSVKTGYLFKYQNTPGVDAKTGKDRERLDVTFTTALVARF